MATWFRWLIRGRSPEIEPDSLTMKMIVGLGNPGKAYKNNRHNIGFQIAELYVHEHGLIFDTRKGKARAALGRIRLAVPSDAPSTDPSDGAAVDEVPSSELHRVLIAKPQTFMNESGRSVASLARFYKVAPADILVVFDDLDLPHGVLRLRASGGAGGHNGMRSLLRELGTNEFPRLRVGIGRPPGRMDPADYVLQDFSPEEEETMSRVRELGVEAIDHWLSQGINSAMNEFNSRGVPL
ncbi:MAG: aminoacyl-tRNA hydrolase [Chloroflexota bacterium]|nr:aminoacyl-tRNA hydrolase [Chloroflexota bacterium]